MILHAVTELATQMLATTSPLSAKGIGDVCPQAPDGVAPFVNQVLGWVKYGVMAIIVGCGFASIGAMIVGKMGSMGRASQAGASGLLWTVLGAIGFVVIYGVLTGIVGKGC